MTMNGAAASGLELDRSAQGIANGKAEQRPCASVIYGTWGAGTIHMLNEARDKTHSGNKAWQQDKHQSACPVTLPPLP